MHKFPFPKQLLWPQHWPVWCAVGIMILISYLPLTILYLIGRGLGTLLYYAASSRRNIAKTNIGLCFPDKNALEQRKLVKQTFIDNTIGILETITAWFRPAHYLKGRTEFIGFDKLERYKNEGRGVLLLGAHYSMLDLAGTLISTQVNISVSYRPHDNPVLNYIMEKSRSKRYDSCFARRDIRGFIRTLKSGNILWYAQDQDFGRRNSVFVNFFGVPTATITATSRIAKAGKAVVLPITYFRKPDNSGYIISIHDPLPIPSGDDERDALIANQFLESQIRRFPSQYLWLHKRFKTRPIIDGVKTKSYYS